MSDRLNDKYRPVFEHSLSACLIITEDGNVLEANSAASKMFGYGIKEFEGLNYTQFLKSNSDRLTLSQSKGKTFEATGIQKNGKHLVCECAISAIKNDYEEELILLQASDISDLKSTGNKGLRLSMLESVVTNTTDSVMITTAHLAEKEFPEIMYVNRAFTELTGYTADEVIGNTIDIFQGPNTADEEQKKIREAFRNQVQTKAELLYYKKNGEEFWAILSLIPVFDDEGNCSHFIVIERDITDRKNRELIKTLQADISRLFNEQTSVSDTVDPMLEIIVRFGHFSLGEIWLVDDNKTSISLTGYKTNDESVKQFYKDSKRRQLFRKGEGMPGITWKTDRTQFWQDIGNHEKFLRSKAAINSAINTAYCIPLRSNNEVLGALLLGVKEGIKRPRYYMAFLEQLGEDLGDEIRRKQLEEELNRTFNFSPDIICVAGMDGYFKKVNPAMCRLLGYTQDELLSHPISEFTHPDDRIRTESEIDNINRNKGSKKFENRYLTKSGKVIWLSWTTRTFFEEGKIYSTARDITEQKELEILLEQANRLAKIGSWEVDLVEGTNYWSDITKEIHEVEPDFEPNIEIGINFYKEGESRERIREVVNNAIENGISYDIEVQIITAKGKELWVRTIGEPEMVDGKCVRFYGSIQDINERKELENLLDQTTKLAKIGSWELDLRKSEDDMYWSDMTREILMVDEDYNPTLTGGFEFYTDKSKKLIQNAVEKAIETGEPFDLELLITTAKGNEKWIRCIGKADMENGKCVRLYGSYQDINPRKKAELAFVQASEERDKILESITDAFYALDEDWNFTYFNHEAENLLGREAIEVLGKNIWIEFSPAVETEIYGHYHEVMETQKPKSFEYYYPPLESWFDISAYPAENGISVYFKNIDKRKKAQQQILEKTRQLDVIAQFNSLLIQKEHWIVALDECLEMFGKVAGTDRVYYFECHQNDNAAQKVISMKAEWAREGIKPELDNPAHHDLPLADISPIMDVFNSRETYKRIVKDIEDREFREFLRGQEIKSLLAIPVFTGDTFRGFIGFDDCTSERVWSNEEISFLETISINLASAIENEDAELALQQAFTEKNEILESIGDGFFALDHGFTVNYWNKQAEELLFTSKEKVLGINLWEIFDKKLAVKSFQQYSKALYEKVPLNFEDYYEPIDRWFDVNVYPSSNGISVFFKDITDRKESEKRLKELNRSLEKQAKELAASNAELEQFAFVASHDLQEPLRMVTSFLALLEKKYGENLDDKANQYINFATDGAKRMRQIIVDLLEFSRVGRAETEREDVDMNDVLADVMILSRKLIDEKNAEITWEGMPVIYANKSSMQQLFQNLVTNALTYQEPGNKPKVEIWAEETDSHWKFYVRDNGIGINPEYSDRIFNIFQRLHTHAQYSGTGVGLAICEKIVVENGGQIGVESEEGNGSTFYFTIAKKVDS